jgi:hypothetical protein
LKIFPNKRGEWVGYPSGARRADPPAPDVEAVTLDMLAYATLLRLIGLPELSRKYESAYKRVPATPRHQSSRKQYI